MVMPDKRRERSASESARGRIGKFLLGPGIAGPGITIRSLEIFVAVAKGGTMVAAAKQLGLTQPAISQVIGALEASLGVQLFDRSVRPPALTLQGATLMKDAAAITDAIRRFQSSVRLGSTAQLPSLRIGMLNSFATSMGPYVIKRLRDVAAEWSIDSGFQATRFRAVVDREFDFIITADESPVPAEIAAVPILTEPFLVIVPSSYDGDGASMKRLSEELDLVRFGRDPHLHARIDRVLQGHGLVPQRRYHLDTSEAVLAMVAMGSGWTILPPLAVFKSIARGDKIRALCFPGKPFHRTIQVASQKAEGLHIAAQIHEAAIHALKTRFMESVRATMPDIADQITLPGTFHGVGGRRKRSDK
jgi:DNA-binding transcriptional LysR family regulator